MTKEMFNRHQFLRISNFDRQKFSLKAERICEGPNNSVSAALVRIEGVNRLVRHTKCLASYTVLWGEGIFDVGGELRIVKKGDTVRIPPGTNYQDASENGMTLLAIDHPEYDPKEVEFITRPLTQQLK